MRTERAAKRLVRAILKVAAVVDSGCSTQAKGGSNGSGGLDSGAS